MMTHAAQFFGPLFKGNVIAIISDLRPMFLDQHKGHDGMIFGWRFTSDEQCWQTFVMGMDIGFMSDSELKAVEIQRHMDQPTMRVLAWKALRNASEADYWYEVEKKWD